MAVIFVLLPLVPPRLLGAAEERPAAPRRRRPAAVGGDLAAAVVGGLGSGPVEGAAQRGKLGCGRRRVAPRRVIVVVVMLQSMIQL